VTIPSIEVGCEVTYNCGDITCYSRRPGGLNPASAGEYSAQQQWSFRDSRHLVLVNSVGYSHGSSSAGLTCLNGPVTAGNTEDQLRSVAAFPFITDSRIKPLVADRCRERYRDRPYYGGGQDRLSLASLRDPSSRNHAAVHHRNIAFGYPWAIANQKYSTLDLVL
jgi:hypothetical protein